MQANANILPHLAADTVCPDQSLTLYLQFLPCSVASGLKKYTILVDLVLLVTRIEFNVDRLWVIEQNIGQNLVKFIL